MKIAVLLGGTSAERDVSLVTGREIAKALSQKGHDVKAIDCAYGAHLIEDWQQDGGQIIHLKPSEIEKQRRELDRNLLDCVRFLVEEKFDAAYLALHGGYGENGQLQALLDLASIPYTGSGVLASAVGMDKNLSKIMFEKYGVPTAPWHVLNCPESWSANALESLGYPMVVKPNDQGSTVGLTIVKERKDLDGAVRKAFDYGHSVMVEKFVPGREVTVAVLDQLPLPIVEIIPEHGIYDYECKYQAGKSRYEVPAKLPEELTRKLQAYALAAYRAIGCRHYARVDFRITDDWLPYCLEVNTLPGMTSTSLVPKAARAAGIEFPELVEKIVQMAFSGNGGGC